jgi:hypothetical protein
VIDSGGTATYPTVIEAATIEEAGAALAQADGRSLTFRCDQRAYRRGRVVRCPAATSELGATPTHAVEVQVPTTGALKARLVEVRDTGGAWTELPGK